MFKIMFVCHGNICRSPMAEFVFKDLIRENGIEDKYYIASSATSSEEIWGGIGNPVYPPAKEELKKHGIDTLGKRAQRLTHKDYQKYDLFVGMDNTNIRNMHKIFGSDPDNKIVKLLDCCGGGDVADPWYTGEFSVTYNDILRGCTALLNSLE